jgi:hypothetical protein
MRQGAAPRTCATALVAAVAGLSMLVSACGQSSYHYVSNKQQGLFVRVPISWHTLRLSESDRPDPVFPEPPWQVLIDSANHPAVGHYDIYAAEEPVGLVEIVALSSSRDSVSLAYLRALSTDLAVDPLQEVRDGSDDIEIVKYDERNDNDFWGNRIVFTAKRTDGTFVTIDQLAMVDTATSHLYRITIRCSAACYKDHQAEIGRIVSSWTLRKG